MIFLKPSTAVNCPGCDIQYPPSTSRLDYEGELAIVMGRRAHHVEPKGAAHHILGYTCANDVTARDLQAIDGQWTRAKGFDGFCPLGPWVETDVDPMDLHIETLLNGKVVPRTRTSDMVFDRTGSRASYPEVMTLLKPGDVMRLSAPAPAVSAAAGA